MKKLLCFNEMLFNDCMRRCGWSDDCIPDNSAFISISYPNENKHWFSYDTPNVLNIDFWDVCDYEVEGIKGLTDDEAEKIYDFIKNNIGKDFYIHCSAGKSRSQAVVRFILDCYEEYGYGEESLNKDNPCLFYNVHVLSLLKKCFRNDIQI